MFAVVLILMAEKGNKFQLGILKLSQIVKRYGIKLSLPYSKTMAFVDQTTGKTRIVIRKRTLEQMTHFNCLGCGVTYDYGNDSERKLNNLSRI